MQIAGYFKPSNPWPDFEPDTEQLGRVWRRWLLVLASDVEALLIVHIRSDDPVTCDVHAVMRQTRDVFEQIDARWPILTLQGVPKEKWLFLK